jgi:hypothetical protein
LLVYKLLRINLRRWAVCEGCEVAKLCGESDHYASERERIKGQNKKEVLKQLKKRQKDLEHELQQVNSSLNKILPGESGDR